MALAIDSAPAASSLAPGFRFHPTDEELVRYYLRRKVCGKPFRFDAISDVDVYKVEPWDLPDLSKLKSRDLEWYFFSALDKKYGNGSRTNRATEKGYWKTTGKDRIVLHRSQQVGMKKTLVYHSGRAPKGERTNWVMHEYRLTDQELQKTGILKDAFVLCRIFQKSGSGPKNGEKYGAPYIEEEWEDDETIFIPKKEDFIEELPVDMDSYLDANDILQILNTDMPVENGENMNNADIPTIVTNDPQPVLMVNQNDGSKSFDPPVLSGSTHGYAGEPNNTVNFDIDYLLDEPYFDATNDEFPLDESLFFEADDLENNVETDSGLDILNEYLSFFNTDMDNKNVLQDSFLTNDVNVNNGDYQLKESSQHFEGQNDKIAPSKQENPDQETDISSGFLKKASYMLGNISAPPAFASEYPTKYMASSSGPSTSVNGMIHISNVSFNGGAVDLSLGKHMQVNIVLSFGLGQREGNSVNSRQVEKVVKAGVSRSWFYSAFMWLLVLSLSFKIGSLVCSMS